MRRLQLLFALFVMDLFLLKYFERVELLNYNFQLLFIQLII